MNKHISVFAIVGLLGFSSLSERLPSVAQTPADEEAPPAVNLPFNPSTDRATTMPINLMQSNNPYGNDRVVVGPDDREPVQTQAFPWSAIGRLDWIYEGQTFASCTATLIGTDLVLTNSHCLLVPNRDSQDVLVTPAIYADMPAKLVFKPNLIAGVTDEEATVTTFVTGWTPESEAPADDWALMTIDQPLGAADRYGHMGWRQLNFSAAEVQRELFEAIQLVGYAGDFPTDTLREFGNPTETAGVDPACSVLGEITTGALVDTLAHDCDTNPGASGGPIFAYFTDTDTYAIVGLHSRSIPLERATTLPNGVSTDVLNGGVLVSRWASQARSLLSQ
ncbi:peptidase s1 and s6 chymotrypsin hap [Leptolyngbya sp. Heron Island J]|uniref:trypsin-like serine peptidase n=1 Tax=Leptolyngbya sp. Heron Island J TaxID=1385935 RepID=UPI0003B9BE2C|nr:trypsin-like peptidase domain-containing protein [Leptolyngbya sp. Heron Island J]ESA37564.1 peptidase s1 and s6 chymotrypsin hap [Leptolyngbya sp. Heron Island J]